MKTGFFLIPTSYTNKKLPLDYRFTEHNLDKRTRFCRHNKRWEVSAYIAVSAAERFGLRVFREDGGPVTRILAPDSKTARAFYTYLQTISDFGNEARKRHNF